MNKRSYFDNIDTYSILRFSFLSSNAKKTIKKTMLEFFFTDFVQRVQNKKILSLKDRYFKDLAGN